MTMTKSLGKMVTEHKDVVKLSIQLSSTISSLRSEVNDLINSYNAFDELWKSVSEKVCQEFAAVALQLLKQCKLKYYCFFNCTYVRPFIQSIRQCGLSLMRVTISILFMLLSEAKGCLVWICRVYVYDVYIPITLTWRPLDAFFQNFIVVVCGR